VPFAFSCFSVHPASIVNEFFLVSLKQFSPYQCMGTTFFTTRVQWNIFSGIAIPAKPFLPREFGLFLG